MLSEWNLNHHVPVTLPLFSYILMIFYTFPVLLLPTHIHSGTEFEKQEGKVELNCVVNMIFCPARRIFFLVFFWFYTPRSNYFGAALVLYLFCLECIAHNFDIVLSGLGFFTCSLYAWELCLVFILI